MDDHRKAETGEKALLSGVQRVNSLCAKGQYKDALRVVDSLIAKVNDNWLWRLRLQNERSSVLDREKDAWCHRLAEYMVRQNLLSEDSLDEAKSLVLQAPVVVSEMVVRDSIKRCLDSVGRYMQCREYGDRLASYREAVDRFNQIEKDLQDARGEEEDTCLGPIADVVKRSLQEDFVKILRADLALELKLLDPLCVLSGGQVHLRLKLVRKFAGVPPIDCVEIHSGEVSGGIAVRYDCNGDENSLMDFMLPVIPSDSAKAMGYGNVKIRVTVVRLIPEGLDLPVDRCLPTDKKTFDVDYLIRTEKHQPKIGNLGYGRNVASGRYFVGREDIVDRIVKCFSPGCRGVRMIIYGQHFCGKSSVLGRIKDILKGMKYQDRSLYQYTDLNAQASSCIGYRQWFLRSLVADRRRGVDSAGMSENECLDIVRAEGTRISDSGMTWVVGVDEFTKPYTNARAPGLSESERNRRRVELNDYLEMIRALIDEGVFCMLAVGQEDTESLMNDDSLFDAVSRFEFLRLSYLQPRHISYLAKAPIEEGRVRDDVYQGNVLHQIQSLTGGHPLFAQLLLRSVFSVLDELRFPFVAGAVLDLAVSRLSESGADGGLRWSDFEPFYQLRSDKYTKEEIVDFLRDYISSVKEECWCHRAKLETADRRADLIDLLLSRDILEVDEQDRIRLRIRLFELWLRKNPQYLGRAGHGMFV